MTPEMKMAQVLSSNEEKQKLASEMREKSVEELEAMLKEANGDMLQYYQDHPEKLKEKRERDAKKEKKSSVSFREKIAMADAWGRDLARKEMEKVAEKDTDRAKRYGHVGMALNAASGVAQGIAHAKANTPLAQLVSRKPLVGAGLAAGNLAAGYGMGRLVHRVVHGKTTGEELPKSASVEKVAVIAFGAGKVLGGISSAAKGAVSAVKNAPKAAKGAAKGVGDFLKKDIAATKQQFSAGLKGAPRPALAPTAIPGIHHNAPPPSVPVKKDFSGLKKGLAIGAGGLALGAGGHAALTHKKEPQQMKAASAEKVAVSFNQMNEGSKMLGRMSRLWDKHGGTVKNVAGKVGKGAVDVAKNVGTRLTNIKDPVARGAAIGAATGGVGGAVQGFLDPKENPITGEKQRLRSAFRKGLAGAAAGAPTGALFGAIGKTSSVKTLEKAAAGLTGLGGIGSMAKNFVASAKPMVQGMASKAMPAIQNAAVQAKKMVQPLKPFAQAATGLAAAQPTGQMMGHMAGGGALGGAVKGLVAPGKDAQGQQRSRLGGMARGAATGAALGLGTAAATKAAVPYAQRALGMRG